MFVVLIVVAIGATQVELNTGNDTLISDDSDIYLENEAYQMEFGRDPIILIFDEYKDSKNRRLKISYFIHHDNKRSPGNN